MSKSSSRAPQSGQYAEMFAKIEKVAIQALSAAAKSAATVKKEAAKPSNPQKSKRSGK